MYVLYCFIWYEFGVGMFVCSIVLSSVLLGVLLNVNVLLLSIVLIVVVVLDVDVVGVVFIGVLFVCVGVLGSDVNCLMCMCVCGSLRLSIVVSVFFMNSVGL